MLVIIDVNQLLLTEHSCLNEFKQYRTNIQSLLNHYF